MKSTKHRHLYWFHPHFYNWMGGHKYILEVIKLLKDKHGFSVTLVTSGLSASAKNKFAAADIPIITLFGFSTNSPFYWLVLPLFLHIEKWYLKYIKKINSNSYFIASMFPSSTLAYSLNKQSTQLCYEPFAFFYDSNFLAGFSTPYQLFARLTKFLYQRMDKETIHNSAAVMTISKFNQKWIERVYKKDSTVVYEGVDTSFFRPVKDAALQKKYLHKKVVFHSTDYTPIKGTQFLIDALQQVIKKSPETVLLISETLPDSPQKKIILQKINELQLENHVKFLGFLPYDQLPNYLSRADVVVQPSINQSMNLTVKEALACQTPIITSLEGNEQTKDGEAGYLVDPHDTAKLAQKMLELLTNAQKNKKMGVVGRDLILKKFSWESVTAKIEQVLACQ